MFYYQLFAKLRSEHSLYDKDAKSSHHIRNWLKNSKYFQFHLHSSSMRLPDYCNSRCNEKNEN